MNKIIDSLIVLVSIVAVAIVSLVLWARLDLKGKLETQNKLTPSENRKSFQIQGMYKNNYDGDTLIILNKDKGVRNSETGYLLYKSKNKLNDSVGTTGGWVLKREGNSLIGTSGYRLMFLFNGPSATVSTISFKIYDKKEILLEIPKSLETNNDQMYFDQFIKIDSISGSVYDKYLTLISGEFKDELTFFKDLEDRKAQYQKLESAINSNSYLKENIEKNNN
ncbi:hypothetical protein I5M27_18440 [Adhaeribacter sp. BT258]|uniref:Uncharacterized protein n=1 Tax=Adhaeribacter terrigena TaxID=2793070 RepID=A0ABS1C6J1_9BACT|nr:hypothetical protein [Adhaeribacter terrigena]MBK0404970.1 hypothetical protein [Adhaeribacter terrigena]